MNNSNIDEQLSMAINLPGNVLSSDENLGEGYSKDNNTWELIVKYSGDISYIAKELNILIEYLSYGYAIVIIDENLIERFSKYPEIEYIEKPRRLYFAINEARAVSCIDYVQRNNVSGLYGEGILVAIIDSGIDYRHADFRNEDGTTRIISLWDQTIQGEPPAGFLFGTQYSAAQINEALFSEDVSIGYTIVPSRDISGHGTFVAGIACGNGSQSNGRYAGVAPRSEIVVVKIGDSIGASYPRTSRLMEALEYVLRIAVELKKPIAINLSFGNNYGEHNGRSILEQFIDNIASTWKNSICIGTGNEGESRKHAGGFIGEDIENIELSISTRQNYVSMQLWKNFKDVFDINIISPNGERVTVIKSMNSVVTYDFGDTIIYIYYGEPTPISTIQEINIILYPKEVYVESGIWIIEITPQNITNGRYDIWLGSLANINEATGFIQPDVYGTLTIPSTAYRAITVGAYDGKNDSLATFSGRGFYNYDYINKPDIVAPGVDITSTANGGGYESRSGTSMATPVVTGSAALMLEWGIVRNNDSYMYGEKLKAYMIKGARILPQFNEYPNAEVGWGALCLKDSIPGF